MAIVQEARFRRRKYIVDGDYRQPGGCALATKAAFANGEVSFAHIFPNGAIMRFGQKIGAVDEIKFGKTVDVKIKAGAFANLMSWGWP